MVIEKLKEVKKLKYQIKFLDESIEETRNQMKHHAIRYSDIPKAAGYKDKVLEMLTEKLEELENKKNRLQIKADMILEELSVLPEMPYRVAIERYVNGLSWYEISKRTGYSKPSCYRFYAQAKEFKL